MSTRSGLDSHESDLPIAHTTSSPLHRSRSRASIGSKLSPHGWVRRSTKLQKWTTPQAEAVEGCPGDVESDSSIGTSSLPFEDTLSFGPKSHLEEDNSSESPSKRRKCTHHESVANAKIDDPSLVGFDYVVPCRNNERPATESLVVASSIPELQSSKFMPGASPQVCQVEATQDYAYHVSINECTRWSFSYRVVKAHTLLPAQADVEQKHLEPSRSILSQQDEVTDHFVKVPVRESYSVPQKRTSRPKAERRSILDTRPGPIGTPPAWTRDRSSLCEMLPWYRAYHSGGYNSHRYGWGYMLDKDCGERKYMDDDIIIARIGGGTGRDDDGVRKQVTSLDRNNLISSPSSIAWIRRYLSE